MRRRNGCMHAQRTYRRWGMGREKVLFSLLFPPLPIPDKMGLVLFYAFFCFFLSNLSPVMCLWAPLMGSRSSLHMVCSIAKALQIVDSSLSEKHNNSSFFKGDYVRPSTSDYGVCENPQRGILPAFRETWRGGANIISPVHGSCFVSADCLWHDRNRISEEEIAELAHEERFSQNGRELVSMIPQCMRCVVHGEPVLCAVVPRERRVDLLVRQSLRDRIKLHRSCRKNYVHGALGLKESPYGHSGEIYADAQPQMALAYSRTVCPLKRQVDYREESLFGNRPLTQSREVRCKGGVPPVDNLFGSLHVKNMM